VVRPDPRFVILDKRLAHRLPLTPRKTFQVTRCHDLRAINGLLAVRWRDRSGNLPKHISRRGGLPRGAVRGRFGAGEGLRREAFGAEPEVTNHPARILYKFISSQINPVPVLFDQCTNDRETMLAPRLATRRPDAGVATSTEVSVQVEGGTAGACCQPRELEKSRTDEPDNQPSESLPNGRSQRSESSSPAAFAGLFAGLPAEPKRNVPEQSSDGQSHESGGQRGFPEPDRFPGQSQLFQN